MRVAKFVHLVNMRTQQDRLRLLSRLEACKEAGEALGLRGDSESSKEISSLTSRLKTTAKPFNKLEDFRFIWIYQLQPFTGRVKSIDNLAESLYRQLFLRSETKTKRHLWLLLRDLAINWIQSESQYLGIHLNANSYTKDSLSRRLGLTYKPMKKVYKRLQESGLILSHEGYYNRGSDSGRITRIKANDGLIEQFRKAGVLDDIDAVYPVVPPSRPVEIRNAKKYPIRNLPITPEFDRLKLEVVRYNDALAKANIDLSLFGYEHHVKIDLMQTFVKRVFHNSSLEQGGRLYGGWWMRCPSDLRSRIFINRVETVELDLKALHPVLLYAKVGVDYFKEIGTDPYAISDLDFLMNRYLSDVEKKQFRNFNKQIFMSLVNNTDEVIALKSLRNARRVQNQLDRENGRILTYPSYLSEAKICRLWSDFKSHHHAIDRFFPGNGVSIPAALYLMRIDSDLIVQVLMRMLDHGILCLSVHDSLIVPHMRRDLAFRVMKEEFIQHLVHLGLKDLDPKIEIDEFFDEIGVFQSLIYGTDVDLLKRTFKFAQTGRHTYINYHPTV